MTVHIVGAGLAGLSAALAIADAGLDVILHELAGKPADAAGHGWSRLSAGDRQWHPYGGRGNRGLFRYLQRIGATDRLLAAPARFPMVDLDTGETWTATPIRLLRRCLPRPGECGMRPIRPWPTVLVPRGTSETSGIPSRWR